MKLSSTHRLVRWAYLFDDRFPDRTTLCAVFWRAVVVTPVLVLSRIAFAVGLFVGFVWGASELLLLAITHWRGTLVTLGIFGFCLLVFTVGYLADRIGPTLTRYVKGAAGAAQDSVFGETVKAIKGKYCPIVEIED